MILFQFFFSSRRRHTRLTCDWSSDVCTSDLVATLEERGAMEYTVVVNAPAADEAVFKYLAPYAGCAMGQHWMDHGEARSEERRVGNECRRRAVLLEIG